MKTNFLLLFTALFFTSCFDSKKENSSETVSLNDSATYIQVADASVINPDWNKENAIVYQIMSEPDNLHPTNGISAMRQEINFYIHKTLMQTDYRTLKVIPGLVKAMPTVSADFMRYTYELSDLPKWDNGQQLSVDDIFFTAKANKCFLTNNPNAKSYWDNVVDIVVDSSSTRKFTVIMKQPYIQNVSMWCDYPILQRLFYDSTNVLRAFSLKDVINEKLEKQKLKTLTQWADSFNALNCRLPENCNGLGAYKVVSWEEGVAITLQRKANHWPSASTSIYETALPDKIIFKIVKDPTAQVLEFKGQNLDGSTTLSNKTLIELQQDSSFNLNYNSAFVSTFNYTYAAFNCKPDGATHKKLFVDKNVRKALALLTPADQINELLNKGKNKRIAGPVSPLKEECDKTLKPISFDFNKGSNMLDVAGWKDTDNDGVRDMIVDGKKTDFKFGLIYFTNTPDWKDYADLMSAEYKKAGIVATPIGLDPGSAQQKMFSHDFDMILSSWGGASAPEDFSQLWATQEWGNNGANFAGFGNTQSDSIINAIKVCMDDTKRIALTKQLQQLIYDEQPYIFFVSGLRRVVMHKRFGNCEFYFERPNLLMNNLKLLSAY
jgi:ABC-type transport system substrate-binding protein